MTIRCAGRTMSRRRSGISPWECGRTTCHLLGDKRPAGEQGAGRASCHLLGDKSPGSREGAGRRKYHPIDDNTVCGTNDVPAEGAGHRHGSADAQLVTYWVTNGPRVNRGRGAQAVTYWVTECLAAKWRVAGPMEVVRWGGRDAAGHPRSKLCGFCAGGYLELKPP